MQVVEETVKKKIRLNVDEYRILHQHLTIHRYNEDGRIKKLISYVEELLLKAYELGQVDERKIRPDNRSKIAANAFNKAFVYDPLMGPAPRPDKTPEPEKPCCETFLSTAICGCPYCPKEK